MGNLILEGKIVTFKTIVVSKIVLKSFITTILKCVIKGLEKITKLFCGKTLQLR